MPGRHRRLFVPRSVNTRLIGAGAAGLAAVFAVAPAALADPADPVTSEAPAQPGSGSPSDTPTSDAPSSDVPSSDAPSSDAPSSDAPSGDVPSSDVPSSDLPSSSAPGAPSSAPSKPKAASAPKKADRAKVAPEVEPDFGVRKVRVGVQIKSGAYVPAGTTTLGSQIRITQTGPTAPGVSTCTTDTPDSVPGSTATFCSFSDTPPFGDVYIVPSGDSVTFEQTAANANLVVDATRQPFGPCDAVPVPDAPPFCLELSTAVFTDAGLPPSAGPDTASTMAGNPVDIDVLTNDTLQGAPTPLTGVSDPAHGTATVIESAHAAAAPRTLAASAPQLIRYTPAPGFVGVDTLTYTVTTANGTATGHVSVTVTAPPPTARNDTASTTSGDPVTIDVVGNDDANGGGALSVAAVGDPRHGTASRHGTSVVYTPGADFVGTDSFTYQAETSGGSDTATVTVTVRAPAATAPDSNNRHGLADTGVPSEELLDLAVAFLVAGGAATGAGRRRRRTRHA